MPKMFQPPKQRFPYFAKLKIRPTRKEILENIWSVVIILMIVGVVGYGIYIQILHHP